MSVAVTLTAEGATQEEANAKIQRMARLLRGKKIVKKGTALPFMIGDVLVGSVQVEGVPDEKEPGRLRFVGSRPAFT